MQIVNEIGCGASRTLKCFIWFASVALSVAIVLFLFRFSSHDLFSLSRGFSPSNYACDCFLFITAGFLAADTAAGLL